MQFYTRIADAMFTVQDEIFRPKKEGHPSYADVSAKLDAYYDDLEGVYDDNFEIRPGKEAEAEAMTERAKELVRYVSGEKWAWPHYEHVDSSMIEAVEQRRTASEARFTQDSMGLHNTKAIRAARRNYADSVARAFLDFETSTVNVEGDRALWPVFASRARVLLAPLTPDMGLWPLPTKKTLEHIHKTISPFQIGIDEVSDIFRR